MDHPLLRPKFTLIAHRGGALEMPEDTLPAFAAALKISPKIMLQVDVRECRDGLVIMADPDVSRTTNGHGRVLDMSLSQLEKLDAGYNFEPAQNFPFRGKNIHVPTLPEVLSSFPNAHIILDIHSNVPDIDKHVIAVVDNFHASSRVLIQSEYDVILSVIKQQRPRWLFGTGWRDLTRTEMLTLLFLEPVAPISGDIFVSPIEIDNHPVLSDRIIQEVHRRGKKVFAGVVNDVHELQYWRGKKVDGIMTDRPSVLWPSLAQSL